MTHREALEVLAAHRGERIVITTMRSAGIWPELSDSPLDFAFLPSSMGQGVPLGLGLALAQPRRGVIVVMGDGSLLMNLGCLVTLASHPAPVWVVLMQNGLYEVTGGQQLSGAGRTDFAGIARGAGIERVYAFGDVEQWRGHAAEALAGSGSVFIHLTVAGELGQQTPAPPRPMSEQIQRLRQALDGR